jgi:hypothetical protein
VILFLFCKEDCFAVHKMFAGVSEIGWYFFVVHGGGKEDHFDCGLVEVFNAIL